MTRVPPSFFDKSGCSNVPMETDSMDKDFFVGPCPKADAESEDKHGNGDNYVDSLFHRFN
jgi:hypothetical protein